MTNHILKTWHEPFQAVWDSQKTFEVRSTADRDFQAGDSLLLREYDPVTDTYTGREIACWTPFVLYGGVFGLPAGLCVMSLNGCTRNETVGGDYVPFWTTVKAKEGV